MVRKILPRILPLYFFCDSALKITIYGSTLAISTNVSAVKPPLVCDADGDSYESDNKKCGGNDCDDSNPNVYPNANELCDGLDNDCDGIVDENCPEPPAEPTRCDQDADGYDADSRSCKGDDCDDTNPYVYPGAEEICNDEIDNDCDGEINEGCGQCPDADNDGYTDCDGDCDDNNPLVNPDATELCDGIDNNCDGTIDEGCSSMYPNSMAAAGDSITVAYNADGTESLFFGSTGYQDEVSWALGDSIRINSHAQRLAALNPGFSWDAEFDNHAISGANIIDLKDQVIQIVQDGPYDYVVILIGHNDICDASCEDLLDDDPNTGMLSMEDFESRFVEAMWILYDQDSDLSIDENPPDVVVSSLARVSDLYNVGKYDNWCTMIWSLGSVCRVVTSGTQYCIDEADKRTQEYNEVLANWADFFGYTYVPQIYETSFTLDDLSDFDCFHPNVSGQNKISEIIWNNGLYAE
ncbi:hypothetical protein DSCW_64560 [Desulfosarcina widdelii]|uniref:SGNH hydrolase-type esterase domain-containing protein n=1 Tax=Desulfosarcina widdelii TaxID=947919 RepID=A0A5K7ZFV4_9BACT|nr:MopE-related protein [Desulfosarcina widdelii]BBO79039.1 hypothetical protein DSCW_64560 [Desulfosarcina widdelii]